MMDEPSNYAMVEDGIVTNVIWLCPSNAGDFTNAFPVNGRLVAVGDTYEDGVFARDGQYVPTEAERLASLRAEISEA